MLGREDPTATHFSGQRALFADIEQNVLSMNTRLNWTFTPTLTLELFAQPFVFAGDYSRFKELRGPAHDGAAGVRRGLRQPLLRRGG